MPWPKAELAVGDRRLEILALDEEPHFFAVGIRPLGHTGKTRGQDISSVVFKRVGMTENWTAEKVHTPELSGIIEQEKIPAQMAMLQYASQVLRLNLQPRRYQTEGDRKGWAKQASPALRTDGSFGPVLRFGG